MFSYLRRLVRSLTRRRSFDRELTEELRDHLERRAADLVASGLSPDEAHRRARIEFGGVEAYKEEVRDGRSWAGFSAAPERLMRDVRFAVRRLAASPTYTVFSIATLALGIGVTTAMYSVTSSFAGRSVGVRAQDEVVSVRQVKKYTHSFSGPEFAELRATQSALRDVTAVAHFATALAADGRADLLAGEAVSGTFFQMLGIPPAQGRLIQPSDDRPEAPPVAVLSDAVWRMRFNADPHAVGAVVRLAGRPFEIVGVAPASFRGVTAGGQSPQALWVPLAVAPGWGNARIDLTSPGNREFEVLGRLPPGVTVADAGAQLAPLVQRLEAIAPLANDETPRTRQVLVTSAFDTSRFGRVNNVAIVLSALPALLLLIASTNLANLSISRGASRRHEFAVRRALGASRWQLIREQLVEGAVVACAGGLVGAFVCEQLLRAGTRIARDTFGAVMMLNATEPDMNGGVLAATAGFAVLAFLTSTLAPALQLTRQNERTLLATDAGAGSAPKWRTRANLIAIQICVSVCLFLLTAVGVRVMLTESRKSGPAGPDHVAQVDVPFRLQQRDEPAVRHLVDRIVENVRRNPGIDDVAMASWGGAVYLTAPERPFVPNAYSGLAATLTVMTPDAFRLAGVTLRFGRAPDGRDGPGQPPVVAISESVAREIFKVADATGRDVLVNLPDMSNRRMVTRLLRVVGVTDNPIGRSGTVNSALYVPFSQNYFPDVSILAGGSHLDTDAIATVLRTAVHSADAELAIGYAGRPNPRMWMQGATLRLLTGAGAVLATIALILSMTGLYGVLSHVVSRRTRELGLRMALGADSRRIVQLILKDGFRPIAEGLALGLAAAFVFLMMVQPAFTIPIEAFDPIAFVLAAGPLLLVGALAAYLPARRASRVDPNVALRNL